MIAQPPVSSREVCILTWIKRKRHTLSLPQLPTVSGAERPLSSELSKYQECAPVFWPNKELYLTWQSGLSKVTTALSM